VRGYGTRVMNRLKCEMQKRGVTHFLTYADNYAIGYFEKQGFVKQLTMPRTRWHGFIKDYDGGTLMECFIHPKIDYLRIPAMLETQREHLRARISKICGASIVYKGLNAEERRKYATDPYSLPGVKEAGWVRPAPSTASDGAGTAGDPASGRRPSMLEAMATLIHDLKRQRFSWPFRQPVDAVLVPGYDQIITDPVDLSLIESRLEKSLYTTKAQLRADIVRMCDNCRVFNKGTQCVFAALVRRSLRRTLRRALRRSRLSALSAVLGASGALDRHSLVLSLRLCFSRRYERLADQLQQYAEPRIKIIPTDAPSALST
jgi:histone acetyltransferase